MEAEFSGKVVLVTGGSSGIGRAAAFAFAVQGARVAVASRNEARGQATVDAIRRCSKLEAARS
jgi:NAD(P)-dependent dehydrogenase (short-subunit alcohol dehydrogenase family)